MSAGVEILFGLAMAVGLVGVLVPVLPGLVLIGAVAVVWALAEGTAAAWAVTAVMIALLVAGTVVKYAVPGRELKAQEVPARTWVLAAAAGIVGFFIVPVVGALLGFVLGAYVGELLRFNAPGPAWVSAKRLLVGIGKGMAVEFATGVVVIVIWLAAVVAL